MPEAIGSTREIRLTSPAHPVRAPFQAEALRDIPEVAPEQEQVPATVPVKVASFQEGFLELVAEAAERERAPAEGRIFGGLLRVEAAKVTARKGDVGRAQRQGCAADAPLAQARWLSRLD
jgi:hypothetical protein